MDPFLVGSLWSKDSGRVSLVLDFAETPLQCDKRVHLEWRQRLLSLSHLIIKHKKDQTAILLCTMCITSLTRYKHVLAKSPCVESQMAALIQRRYGCFAENSK